MQENNLHAAQKRIKKNREVGKSLKEKLTEMKKITAGRLFHSDSVRVGQTILDVYNENCNAARAQDEKVQQQSKETYQKQRAAADEKLQRNLILLKCRIRNSESSSSLSSLKQMTQCRLGRKK